MALVDRKELIGRAAFGIDAANGVTRASLNDSSDVELGASPQDIVVEGDVSSAEGQLPKPGEAHVRIVNMDVFHGSIAWARDCGELHNIRAAFEGAKTSLVVREVRFDE
jgi:hypothetical protein